VRWSIPTPKIGGGVVPGVEGGSIIICVAVTVTMEIIVDDAVTVVVGIIGDD
jgi:hypothetical protein